MRVFVASTTALLVPRLERAFTGHEIIHLEHVSVRHILKGIRESRRDVSGPARPYGLKEILIVVSQELPLQDNAACRDFSLVVSVRSAMGSWDVPAIVVWGPALNQHDRMEASRLSIPLLAHTDEHDLLSFVQGLARARLDAYSLATDMRRRLLVFLEKVVWMPFAACAVAYLAFWLDQKPDFSLDASIGLTQLGVGDYYEPGHKAEMELHVSVNALSCDAVEAQLRVVGETPEADVVLHPEESLILVSGKTIVRRISLEIEKEYLGGRPRREMSVRAFLKAGDAPPLTADIPIQLRGQPRRGHSTPGFMRLE